MVRTAKSLFAVLALAVVVGAGAAVATGAISLQVIPGGDPIGDGPLETFDDETDYAAYLERGGSVSYASATAGGTGASSRQTVREDAVEADGDGDAGARVETEQAATPAPQPTGTPVAEADTPADGDDNERRVAGTNVQERGIDEPDLVKTDGRYFFYAPDGRMPHEPRPVAEPTPVTDTPTPAGVEREEAAVVEERDVVRERPTPRTHVVDTSEPADPELVERINVSGRMLRSGDTLVVIASDALLGYDVSDPENPTREWERPLESALVTARAQGDQVYLVTRERASPARPCPLEPVGASDPVPCTDIHYPTEQIDADVTYTALSLDPDSGDVADATSFVGTRDSTVVYMSEDALYVTYTTRTDRMELATDYLLEESDEAPDHVTDRIREIRSYDLSPRAERVEVSSTIENWLATLDDEERRAVQKSLREGLEAYTESQKRELTETGVVKVGVGSGDLTVEAVGEVPGEPLNQFSLDAHDGTLRIATTIPGVGGTDSENDLYVLDANSMAVRGSETGMGVTEEIYSVRYVGDTAYMVTFRQVDPFHVIDLSNPDDPTELGELELPGFSDYLHPVGDDVVVGIGQEDRRTKVVLFDASDPTDPRIADDVILDEHFSAVSGTHHAFLHDARHEAIFLPAGDEGVVMSYADDELSIEKKVDLDGPAERARYVDDYLYVFAPGEIRVLDETTWETETSLELPR